LTLKILGDIDPSQKLTIGRSIAKTIKLIMIGLVFVLAGIWFIHVGGFGKISDIGVVIGWFVTVFFGACSTISLWYLFFGDSAPVTLSPSGFRDTRSSATALEWSSLTGISKWTTNKTPFVLLEMPPEEFEKLALTWTVRIGRFANKKIFGKDCLAVNSLDLDCSFAELEAAIKAYAHAHNPALRK